MSYFEDRYEYKTTSVSAQAYNRKITVELPLDASMDDILEAFRTVVIGLTFHEDTWKDAIVQLAQEYLEDQNEQI